MKSEEVEAKVKSFALDTAEDFGRVRSNVSIEKLKELQKEVIQMANKLAKPKNFEEFATELQYSGTTKTGLATKINNLNREHNLRLQASVRNGEIILKAY